MEKHRIGRVMRDIQCAIMKMVRKTPRVFGQIAVTPFEENFERSGFPDKTLER